MNTSGNILVVDDEPGMLRYLQTLLEVDSYCVSTASSGVEALACVQREPAPDVVLLDLLMPDLDGLQTLEKLRQARSGLKVVMLSCVSDTRKVAHAIRLGAHDYLTKPFQKAELDAVLDDCLHHRTTLTPSDGQSGEVEELSDDLYFVAASRAMRKIRQQVGQVANVNVPVLIVGESGAGKEVVAHLIHKLSPRADHTFLRVSCSATSRGRLLGRRVRSRGNLSNVIREPSCWMKSGRCLLFCRRSSCTCYRTSSSPG